MTIRLISYSAPALLALFLSACSGGSDDNSAGAAGAAGGVASAGTSSGGAPVAGAPGGGAGPSPGGVTNGGSAVASAGAGGTAAGTAGAGGSTSGAAGANLGGGAGSSGAATGGTGGTGGNAGGSGGSAAGSGGSAGGGSTTDPALKVVMYLPNWNGTFSSWAAKLDFNKMTHLDLAFGTIKSGTNDWDLGASDADVKAIAAAAHAKNVKVLVSIGGADDDIGIINRYATAANIEPMVTNLDAFITRLDLDGVDVDLERGKNLKANTNFPMFLSTLIAKLRPKGKVVSTALAQYILEDTGDDAATTATWLNTYDFINLMIYTNNMNTYTSELNWWTTQRHIAKNKLTWGVDFSGGTNADMVKQLTVASKAYGGVMAWELSQKAAPPLWKAVQDSL